MDTAIEALIFDCDGTLTDSMPVHYVAWRQALAPYGIEFDEDRFYALAGIPTDRIIALLAAERGIVVNPRRAAEEKEAAFLEVLHTVEPVPSVRETVLQHRGRLKMAVASGGWRSVVLQQLRHIGLEDCFEAIVTAEDTEQHKPAPDVFLEAARRLNVRPEACLVYEDSDLGIEAARRAGMQWTDVRTFHRPRRITG